VSARGPIRFDQALYDYTIANWLRDSDVKRALRERTAKLPNAGMQISPDQGQLMALLARSIGARMALEVGTFTGYSALCVAEALPPSGKLIACDISDEYTSIGKPFWQQAGVADRIELRIAPAIATLRAMPPERTIDLAFVDADKPMYGAYADELLDRMRPGGVLMVDNVLWSGAVVDAAATDENTVAIRAFNDRLAADDRVETVMLPLGDGLTLARRV
jgi:predicted O-methyltransferase YrrM